MTCRHGHDLTDPGNVYQHPGGFRVCRKCKETTRRRYEKCKGDNWKLPEERVTPKEWARRTARYMSSDELRAIASWEIPGGEDTSSFASHRKRGTKISTGDLLAQKSQGTFDFTKTFGKKAA